MRTADLSSSLEAFLASCLILLDKNPGLKPIGVIEVLQARRCDELQAR